MSSKHDGLSCVSSLRMPLDSSWKTPMVSPPAMSWYGGASSSGSVGRASTATPRLCADAAHDVGDQRQRLQAEEVELDEADRLDVGAPRTA